MLAKNPRLPGDPSDGLRPTDRRIYDVQLCPLRGCGNKNERKQYQQGKTGAFSREHICLPYSLAHDRVKTLVYSWSGKPFGKLFDQPVESFRLINEQRVARAPENFDLGPQTIHFEVVSLGLELRRHDVKQRFGKATRDLPPMRPRKRIGQQGDTIVEGHALCTVNQVVQVHVASLRLENSVYESSQRLTTVLTQLFYKSSLGPGSRCGFFANGTVDEHQPCEAVSTKHADVLQSLDGAQRPTNEQNLGKWREKFVNIRRTSLSRVAEGWNLRFTLPAGIQGKSVIAWAQLRELPLPQRSRHGPAGDEGDRGFFFDGVLHSGFEKRQPHVVTTLEVSPHDLSVAPACGDHGQKDCYH